MIFEDRRELDYSEKISACVIRFPRAVSIPFRYFRIKLLQADRSTGRLLIRAEEYGIDFRTVSRSRKSPHRFYVLRDALADLEHKPKIIVRDIRSFAVLYRNVRAGTLEIEFNWLNGNGYNLMGWEETETCVVIFCCGLRSGNQCRILPHMP